MKNVKYIFVTGGVVSGLGKGITAASLGRLLKGERIQGDFSETGSVYQCGSGHDEPLPARRGISCTEDGAETDLDLGHYERFIDENLNKYSEPHFRQRSTGMFSTKRDMETIWERRYR